MRGKKDRQRLKGKLYQLLKEREEERGEILYTVVQLRWTLKENWELKYCKCYGIVLHNMLFLIVFWEKKDVNFLFSFLFLSTLCVCCLYDF
jgi:hypothetical protein